MKKYEYKVVNKLNKLKSEELSENELNDLGELGWELIHIDRKGSENYTYYFKRFKNEEDSN